MVNSITRRRFLAQSAAGAAALSMPYTSFAQNKAPIKVGVIISLSGRTAWASRMDTPESYRLISGLASPGGVARISEVFDAARLHHSRFDDPFEHDLSAETCILHRDTSLHATPERIVVPLLLSR